ncbi:AAA family ATPase [Actinomadura opuntiae]|uniref:AAA family ATPase n=1 Tax=Actinomadura sp. OS1-43 TaxID=604315 RepID=UPI00255AC8B8|nr:AAA family ATPase [Actinomadura sp. OS1-43]MDL4817734.1 AAA family ATPase [Actinomadura sp. OS1-43]
MAENYRAFKIANIQLSTDGLVLVAGANNTGKSALLSAIDLVAGIDSEARDIRHAQASTPARVIATFLLEERERSRLLEGMVDRIKRRAFLSEGFLSRLEYHFEERGRYGIGLVEVRGEWYGEMNIMGRIKWDPVGDVSNFLISSEFIADQPQASMMISRGQFHGDPWIDPNFPDIPLCESLLEWRQRYYHFRALRPGTARTMGLSSDDRLDPTGQNLPGVLLNLKTQREEIFEELRHLIAEMVPEIGKLEIRTQENRLQITFSNSYTPGTELNLKDLGTGVEQLLLTAVVGLIEESPFTLIIEEPETNLHSAAQRALLNLLSGWATDRQIIAATHSPVMLDWSPGDGRLWLVTREKGVSNVATVGNDPLAALNSLGVRPSDILSANRVLVLEGPSDEEVFAAWFPHLIRDPRVAVLFGEGGDNARHGDRFAKWLVSGERLGLQRALYIRDRDELSREALEKLEKSSTVFILSRRELENYLLDPEAIASVLKRYIDDENEAPDASDVVTAMENAAENLREVVVINRVARAVKPPRMLMDHQTRRRLVEDRANLEEITTTVLERLASVDEIRAQIASSWASAREDVDGRTRRDLLNVAPGEEILDAVFRIFTGRRYRKRVDGPAIAKAMVDAPREIQEELENFMAD